MLPADIRVLAATSGDAIGTQRVKPELLGDPAQAATWTLTRRVEAAGRGVTLTTTVAVDRRRELVHLPWLTLLAGLERFGARKSQALLPGVEYLADEPSSNEKEIRGPAANRRIVDPLDVCFPTMVIAAGHGLTVAEPAEVAGIIASRMFDAPAPTRAADVEVAGRRGGEAEARRSGCGHRGLDVRTGLPARGRGRPVPRRRRDSNPRYRFKPV